MLVGAPLVACTLLIAGCTTSFVYNRLDTLASWYFESLVSLNDEQRSELRAWLGRTLAWHRESELTRYAAFVSEVSTTVAQPSPRETYDAMRIRFQDMLDELIAKTAPEASRLLLQLSPEQVEELLQSLEEKSRKSMQESAAAAARDEWRPKQTKSILKQVKRWTGNVTPQQMELVTATIAQLEPTYEDWADSQRAWRGALRQALSQRRAAEDDAAAPQVLAILEDPDRHWTPAYSQKVTRNRERYQQLLVDLDASLTPQQRSHLRRQLNELAATLAGLSRA